METKNKTMVIREQEVEELITSRQKLCQNLTALTSISYSNFMRRILIRNFYVAPCDLKPQIFKKPSAKRLSKKGYKINAKIYKNKQA